MQSFGAHQALHYTAQALCARGMRAVVLPRNFGLRSIVAPGVRLAWHLRQRQELRRQRCTVRRIGGCDNHCDDNDDQHGRASHGRRGRDVRYARTVKENQAKPASLIPPFWSFWLTIQNKTNRKVRNLFHLLAVFISLSI